MIYHYCATYQDTPGQTTFIDGVITLDTPIQSMDDYKKVKSFIEPGNAHILTILSLTLLSIN